jgi:D-tyrosyl-tRNA(Tyr) deacylase
VVQRVLDASVTVAGETVGQIEAGLVVLLGVADDDDGAVADRLAARTARLRIFPDDAGRFARSVLDTGGDALVVPNFTLVGDTGRGHRPSFAAAADPATAEPLFDRYVGALRDAGVATVATGRFGATMRVALVGDGPVTIVLDAGTASPDRASVTLP